MSQPWTLTIYRSDRTTAKSYSGNQSGYDNYDHAGDDSITIVPVL